MKLKLTKEQAEKLLKLVDSMEDVEASKEEEEDVIELVEESKQEEVIEQPVEEVNISTEKDTEIEALKAKLAETEKQINEYKELFNKKKLKERPEIKNRTGWGGE